jgi:hypothetical protein
MNAGCGLRRCAARRRSERDNAVKQALGLRLDEARALTTALDADLSADSWGYAQLGDVADEIQRATVSDQIRSAAHGIEENLVEARLHELDVSGLVGPHGVPMAYANASVNDPLRNDRLEMNTVGFSGRSAQRSTGSQLCSSARRGYRCRCGSRTWAG